METVQIDPAQIQAITDAIANAANLFVSGCAAVCFWLGMNSWETSAK
jgi:hypothetical protein